LPWRRRRSERGRRSAGSLAIIQKSNKNTKGTKMSDLDAVRIAVHQNNVSRYRRLLRTKLTEIERQYVERRLAEERQSLELLTTRQPVQNPHRQNATPTHCSSRAPRPSDFDRWQCR
jgi:hypothetical protein